VHLYRTVDREGNTDEFRLSAKRDVGAAKAFFRKATKSQRLSPGTITVDGYAASHRAVRDLMYPLISRLSSPRNKRIRPGAVTF
jgi:transposase-like protein